MSSKPTAFAIREAEDQSKLVTAVTADTLLKRYQLPQFDFIKIDIEGAEREVFAIDQTSHTSWLRNTNMVVARVVGGCKWAI